MAVDRKQQMKEITERLEQGVKDIFTSEMYTTYLHTMAKFHNYSFNNTLLIAMQRPDATLVQDSKHGKTSSTVTSKKAKRASRSLLRLPSRKWKNARKSTKIRVWLY